MYTTLSYLPTLLLPSKTSFARYVKQNIFDPLGLTSTTYSYPTAKQSGQLADGMTRQYDSLRNGTARFMPFWAPQSGEDGFGKVINTN
jgi:CubicO group peptidase (beta-lactamase class C family)